MLSRDVLERILSRTGSLSIGVIGDLFLDRYLDLDARLTEPSLETGLDAFQVVAVRAFPGAAGTVINNLCALGVARVSPLTVIGDDGEGYELRQALARLPAVSNDGVLAWPERRTPTYTKPMLHEPGELPRELNRLDIHNRTSLPDAAEERVLALLEAIWPRLDALVILDQVSQPDCGVVTRRVRDHLASLAVQEPARPVLADSRERIGQFRGVRLKPNVREARAASGVEDLLEAARRLARPAGREVFVTRGEQGILVMDPEGQACSVPACPVTGPVDPVGAGDSTSAGIICALAAGASPAEAAAFGCLVASVTVQQIGTTGTATPEQVRHRWLETHGQ